MVRLLSGSALAGSPSPIDWDSIPVEYPLPGIERQTVHGQNQTLVRYIYRSGSVFPVHQHPEEQITIVLSGCIDFTVDGAPITLCSGESAIIPANTPHGARVTGSDTVVTLNTMAPRRSAAPNPAAIDKDAL